MDVEVVHLLTPWQSWFYLLSFFFYIKKASDLRSDSRIYKTGRILISVPSYQKCTFRYILTIDCRCQWDENASGLWTFSKTGISLLMYLNQLLYIKVLLFYICLKPLTPALKVLWKTSVSQHLFGNIAEMKFFCAAVRHLLFFIFYLCTYPDCRQINVLFSFSTYPGDKLAQYDPVREYVGAMVVPASAQAFGGHPPRRPHARQPVAVPGNNS